MRPSNSSSRKTRTPVRAPVMIVTWSLPADDVTDTESHSHVTASAHLSHTTPTAALFRPMRVLIVRWTQPAVNIRRKCTVLPQYNNPIYNALVPYILRRGSLHNCVRPWMYRRGVVSLGLGLMHGLKEPFSCDLALWSQVCVGMHILFFPMNLQFTKYSLLFRVRINSYLSASVHNFTRSTPWSIKKRATFVFPITLANIDGFS